MEIVHVRGRVVRGADAYFLARYDDSKPRGYGDDIAQHDTRFDLEVDGRTITVELAHDTEGHHRGGFIGSFREAKSDDSTFPWDSSPSGSDEDVVRVVTIGVYKNEMLEVWGEVVETELEAAGYRDAPSKLPTLVRARAIDAPIVPPAIISLARVRILVALATLAAVFLLPMGPASPFVRFWMCLALSIAVGRSHWRVVPLSGDVPVLGSMFAPFVLMALHIALALVLLMGLGPFPAWLVVVACVLLGAHALASLAFRRWRMRQLREVARRLAMGADAGIVRAIENRESDYGTGMEIKSGDTLVVMFDHEERCIRLSDLAVFDAYGAYGARPGTRVLVGNGALYASWEDPRAELDHLLLWDRRFTWIVLPLAVAMAIITYLAYHAPRIAG